MASKPLQVRISDEVLALLEQLTKDEYCTKREMIQRLIVDEYKRRYPPLKINM